MQKHAHDHWVPKRQHELAGALAKVYPADTEKLRRMKKAQLFAIWFRLWRERGCHGCR